LRREPATGTNAAAVSRSKSTSRTSSPSGSEDEEDGNESDVSYGSHVSNPEVGMEKVRFTTGDEMRMEGLNACFGNTSI